MLLALFDWTWNSTPWILWPLLALVGFVVVYLLISSRQGASTSPAAASPLQVITGGVVTPGRVAPKLAPSANPFDVKVPLEELAQLALLEGQTDIARILSNFAAGDEEETHRAIRELAILYRSPRAITAAAKHVVLRHVEELFDDPDVRRILDRRKA
jgi:hypothetical protein